MSGLERNGSLEVHCGLLYTRREPRGDQSDHARMVCSDGQLTQFVLFVWLNLKQPKLIVINHFYTEIK